MKKPRMLHRRHLIMGASFEFEFLQPSGNKVSSRWWLSTSYTNNLQSTAFALGEVCPCLENVVVMQSHWSSLLYVWTQTKKNEEEGWWEPASVWWRMTIWHVSGHVGEPQESENAIHCLIVAGLWSWDPTSPNIFFLVISDLPTSLRGEGSHRWRAQE